MEEGDDEAPASAAEPAGDDPSRRAALADNRQAKAHLDVIAEDIELCGYDVDCEPNGEDEEEASIAPEEHGVLPAAVLPAGNLLSVNDHGAVPPSSRKASAHRPPDRDSGDSDADSVELSRGGCDMQAVCDRLQLVAASRAADQDSDADEAASPCSPAEGKSSDEAEGVIGDITGDTSEKGSEESESATDLAILDFFHCEAKTSAECSDETLRDTLSVGTKLRLPVVLRYKRESEQVVHDVPEPESLDKRYALVWDEDKKRYVVPGAMARNGLLCDFCGQEQYAPSALVSHKPRAASSSSLSSPSDDDLSRMEEEGEYCCLQYFHLCKLLLLRWASQTETASSSLLELIDIGPSRHYGSKEARKAAKRRILDNLRQRDLVRKRALAYYDGTRKGKTISFSMADHASSASEGWILAPDPVAIQESSRLYAMGFGRNDQPSGSAARSAAPPSNQRLLILPQLAGTSKSPRRQNKGVTRCSEYGYVDWSEDGSSLSMTSSTFGSGSLLSATTAGSQHWHGQAAPFASQHSRDARQSRSTFPQLPPTSSHWPSGALAATSTGGRAVPRLPDVAGSSETPIDDGSAMGARTRRHSSFVSPTLPLLPITTSSRRSSLSSQGGALPPVSRSSRTAVAAMVSTPHDMLIKLLNGSLSHGYKDADIRYYGGGGIFLVKLPDGSSTCYYPDGSVAVCMSAIGDGRFVTLAYEPQRDEYHRPPPLVAVFNPAVPHGCCYGRDGCIRLLLDGQGGALYDPRGGQQRRWSWLAPVHLSRQNHAPPFQPVCLSLSNHLAVRCVRHDNIVLTFTFGHLSARLPISFPTVSRGGHQKASPYTLLHNDIKATKAKLTDILRSVSNLVQKPNSYKRARFLPAKSISQTPAPEEPLRVVLNSPPRRDEPQAPATRSSLRKPGRKPSKSDRSQKSVAVK